MIIYYPVYYQFTNCTTCFDCISVCVLQSGALHTLCRLEADSQPIAIDMYNQNSTKQPKKAQTKSLSTTKNKR